MARTKQTARKSAVRVTPPVSDESSSSSSSPDRDDQRTKRPLEQDITGDADLQSPTKKVRLGNDPLIRNKVHFRIHSIADLVKERYPSMAMNGELMDRSIERAKHQLLDELEEMLIDSDEKK